MEKTLYWKIQVANQSPELEVGSLEMQIYKAHNLKDYTTREEMTDAEAQEHYSKNAWKNPLFSKMVSLTLGFTTEDSIRIKHFTGNEKDLITQFINEAKSPHFNSFRMACFDAEYLLPYLGIRASKNKVDIAFPKDLEYKNMKPWNLSGICIRDYYQGAGAYKPTLKELAYIYDITTGIVSRYDELNMTGEELKDSAVEEMKTLINVHRAISKTKALEEVKVTDARVENVTVETSKNILVDLYHDKVFDAERMKAHLKSRKVLKKDLPLIKKFILSSYYEKIDVTAFNKKELKEINEQREKEVDEFLKNIK